MSVSSIAGTSFILRAEDIDRILCSLRDSEPSSHVVEVKVVIGNQSREFTLADFASRLGFRQFS
ncbi:MAG TPA: hypothetical protein VJK02_06120 [Anaerolineales bacterium]|nr:hypothetical protein [Anaerolineales bacterium]HLE04628.1 hypothetical protein [Anaerolineales bacterium]